VALPKITIPLFELTIPSTQEKVMFRCMTFGDEKLLLVAKESREYSDVLLSVKQVVSNCCQNATFDIDKITIFDLEFLFLRIRSHSISNTVKIVITDDPSQEDSEKHTVEVNLDEIEIDMSDVQDPLIKLGNDVGILLKYPPASLYGDREIANSKDGLFSLIVKSIDKIYVNDTEINPKTITKVEMKDWIEKLDTKSYDRMRKFFQNMPSFNHKIKYTNSAGVDKSLTLSSLSDFFSF
jgi:T4 bacteriophage base plate protein